MFREELTEMLIFVPRSKGAMHKPSRHLGEFPSRQSEYCFIWFLCSFSVSLTISSASPSLKFLFLVVFVFCPSLWTKWSLSSSVICAENHLLDVSVPDRFCHQLEPVSLMSLKSISSSLPSTRSSSRYVPLYLSTTVWLSPSPQVCLLKTQTSSFNYFPNNGWLSLIGQSSPSA